MDKEEQKQADEIADIMDKEAKEKDKKEVSDDQIEKEVMSDGEEPKAGFAEDEQPKTEEEKPVTE